MKLLKAFLYLVILTLSIFNLWVMMLWYQSTLTIPPVYQMQLTSPEFKFGEAVPPKFTCQGAGINPKLEISDVPPTAKSLALIFYDPDAPLGTFTHWIIWNIDPKTTTIEENSAPGIQGRNSGGKNGYYPPCPPSGSHRYYFKLYALNAVLNLPAGSDISEFQTALKGHAFDSIELMGTYKKH